MCGGTGGIMFKYLLVIMVFCSLISAEEYFGEAINKAVEYEDIIMGINNSSAFNFNFEYKMNGGFGGLTHAYRYSTKVEFKDDTILIIKIQIIHYSKYLRSRRNEWYEEDNNEYRGEINLKEPIEFTAIKELDDSYYRNIIQDGRTTIHVNKECKDYLNRIEKVIIALNMVYMYEL